MAVKVRVPRWTLGQHTTFELRDLRTELEHEIERASAQSQYPSRAALQARLADVIAEQEGRQAAELASRQRGRDDFRYEM